MSTVPTASFLKLFSRSMLMRNVTTSIFTHGLSTINKKRRRETEKEMDRFFPSLCTNSYPDYPLSVLTPASPQIPVNNAYVICSAIIALSTHLLCPSVHFTELELPAATLEEKKRWAVGTGACMALASPPDPRIQ